MLGKLVAISVVGVISLLMAGSNLLQLANLAGNIFVDYSTLVAIAVGAVLRGS